ncbi:MAG: hypothetical protein ACFUZC_08075 [Chthoniobacteraceae bacterium]
MASSLNFYPYRRAAFSLVELLVSTIVLLIILIVLFQLMAGLGGIWRSSRGKLSGFQNARSAFSTLNRTLSRATLNAYSDYVDVAEKYRTVSNAATFVPAKFMRASELHFISGPAAQGTAASIIVPKGDTTTNPGDAVFFQASTGYTDDSGLHDLRRTVNSMGFYIQYGDNDDSILPKWLKPLAGASKRFRLLQIIEPTEDLGVYQSTALGKYDLSWLGAFAAKEDASAARPRVRPRVLAEDIPLLIVRPRLSPQDEKAIASQLGSTFSDATKGSILCPNYHYDSRAWAPDYPEGQRVKAAAVPAVRANVMRNQLPPIIDLVMVSVDQNSLAHFNQTSDLPPPPLRVPTGLFSDSSKLEDDLAIYCKQLVDAKIRFRVFRTAVPVLGAKWTNN